MRKVQVGDAAREYAQLAKRLDHEEIDPQYAALAHLAAARFGEHFVLLAQGKHADVSNKHKVAMRKRQN